VALMLLSMPPNTMPWNGEMDHQLAWPARITQEAATCTFVVSFWYGYDTSLAA
jgi:hypothetical protein